MTQEFDAYRNAFNTVADVYAATRAGYAGALFDDLIAECGLGADDAILEIGCGTGQATAGFAARGLRVLAIDPGAALIDLARRKLSDFPKVSFAVSRFEDLPAQRGAFRLVAAAQSWHWVPVEAAFAKAREALAPGGHLAIWGHVPVGIDPAPLSGAIEAVHRDHLGAWGQPPEAAYLPSGPFPAQFEQAGDFGPIDHRCYPWRESFDTNGYIALQTSKSYYQVLPAARREALFAAVAQAIDANGGRCEVAYETHLYVAHRRD